MPSTRSKPSAATAARVTPANFAEPFCDYFTTVHHALRTEADPAPALAEAEQVLAGVSPELAATAGQGARGVRDQITAFMHNAGPVGYGEWIRKGGAAECASVITTVAEAMVTELTRKNLSDAEAALATADGQVEQAKADLASAIESGDVEAMRRARDVIDLSGPVAVDTARDAVVQAQLAIAKEAEAIAAELTAPLRERTAQAKATSDVASAEAERRQGEYENIWTVGMIGEDAQARLGVVRGQAEAMVAASAAEAEASRQERLARMIGSTP